jgi:hypothetical protein
VPIRVRTHLVALARPTSTLMALPRPTTTLA